MNDTHGHLAGDQVLREMAKLTRNVVRESDVISRWGGEEFLILLKGCAMDKAFDVAEKLRQAVATHEFMMGASATQLTISLGVAEYLKGESLSEFFSRADEGLYLAKNRGRNQTVCLSAKQSSAEAGV